MRSKFMSLDYRDELANITELKGFSQSAENLLLSMIYKIEDGYDNYQTVKREVPSKAEFIEKIVKSIREDCESIEIVEPRSELAKELADSKCKIMTAQDARTKLKRVISFPNEKNLLYGVSKIAIPPLRDNMPVEEQAMFTAINIGRCISNAEAIRDFSGWTWSILENEIESTECNVIYVFLSILLGYEFLENVDISRIQRSVSIPFFQELKKVSTQFYLSYDKAQNEEILKKIYESKKKLEKMRNQSAYVIDIAESKKNKLMEIKQLDETLNNPKKMREEYLAYNSTLPDEQKIFSVSHYEEKLQNKREKLLKEIEDFNKMQNPIEFVKEKEKLQYEIKFYEEKTDISKLEKEFLKCFEKRIEDTNDRRRLLDIIYEIRYLNFLPNCKMKLNEVEEKIIPKAIRFNVIAPISNNNILDYRILKGIFNSQTVSLENLYIRLSSDNNRIKVEIYDGDMLEMTYYVNLPEGSSIEIRRSKKMKIFG